MPTNLPTGYRLSQIVLHWLVAAGVLFLFVTGDNMTAVFRSQNGGKATDVSANWAGIHIVVGLAVMAALVWRLGLRNRFGAPPPPAAEAPPLRWLAGAVHIGLYLDLIAASLVGVLAYWWAPSLAPTHEVLSRAVLIVLFVPHLAGALWHHFYWRDDVLRRMLRPTRQ